MCLNRCLHKLLKEWWINTIHISIIYNQTRKRMAKSCPRKRDNKEKYKLKKQNVTWTRSWWSFRDYIASSWLWKRTVHSRLYFEVTEFSRFQIKTWNFISQRSIESDQQILVWIFYTSFTCPTVALEDVDFEERSATTLLWRNKSETNPYICVQNCGKAPFSLSAALHCVKPSKFHLYRAI